MKTKIAIAIALLAVPVLRGLAVNNSESNAPTVEVLLERAIEHAKRESLHDAEFKRNYWYDRMRIMEYKNSKGEVKKREERFTRHDPFKARAGDAKKAANAKPVKPSSGSEDVSDTNSKVKGQAFEKDDFPLDGDLLSRFEFTLAGSEIINGRKVFVLDFKPANKTLPERGIKDRFINRAAGRVWLDAADSAVAKAELYLTKRVNVAGGLVGAVWKFNCKLERERTPEGWWYMRHSDWHLEGRELFVQRIVNSSEDRTKLKRARNETPCVDAAR